MLQHWAEDEEDEEEELEEHDAGGHSEMSHEAPGGSHTGIVQPVGVVIVIQDPVQPNDEYDELQEEEIAMHVWPLGSQVSPALQQ